MPTIAHFEIPANEVERAKKFYSELFGWKIEKDANFDYWMIETTDEKGQKGVCGGMMKRQHPQQMITNYIDIPSVDHYTAKVQSLGGMVIMPKTPVPNIGYFAICMDTESNVFGIWETNPNAK